MEKNLNIDTRITTLGHIQREGIPCAYDRFLVSKVIMNLPKNSI